MKRKLLFFALGILCMAFSATAVFLVVDRDKTGPVIAVPEDGSLTYVAGEDKKILLEGVTASDSEDGDVSDTLVIESIRPNGDRAVVTYTAVDHSHNASKASCVVNYQTETEEEETIAGEKRLADSEDEAEELQENSETKAQKDVEDAIADLPKESPRFRLSQHEVMLAVGEVFDYSQYISDVTDDKDSREQLYGRIRLQGKVDTSKAGIYEISYFVVDSDKNQSNVEVLTVKVE